MKSRVRLLVAAVLGLGVLLPAVPANAAPDAPPLEVVLDEKLRPDLATVADPASDKPDVTVPVSAFVGPDTGTAMFVSGDLIVHDGPDLAAKVADALGGAVVAALDPGKSGVKELASYQLVRFDPSTVDPKNLVEDLTAIDPDIAYGRHRVSDKAGLGTLAAAARIRAAGLPVDLDWVSANQSIRMNSTVEAAGIFVNAFTWTSLRDIEVPAAWNLLARAGRFAPGTFRAPIAIVDSGFSAPDLDRPLGGNIPSLQPSTLLCGTSPCPFHGSDVTSVALALPDNGFGGAGAAGPIGVPLMFNRGGTIFTDMSASLSAISSGARIINMSFGGSVPAVAGAFLGGYDALTAAVRSAGVMQFAAAGNAGRDVDVTTCVLACWEDELFFPCENTGVVCVGGLGSGGVPSTGSNFASGGLDPAGTVDVWAPFCGFAGPNDGALSNAIHGACGTSISTPLVSGVAALLLSASNGASADVVEPTLFATANPGGCVSAGRCAGRIVSARRGTEALLGNLPPDLRIQATSAPAVGRGTPISFLATAADPEGAPLTVSWFIDGATVPFATGTAISNDFVGLSYGSHTIRATVEDGTWAPVPDAGNGVVITLTNTPPVMTINQPVSGQAIYRASFHRDCYFVGTQLICPDNVYLSATSLDRNNQPSTLPDSAVTWFVDGRQVATGHSAVIWATSMPFGVHVITVTGTDGVFTSEASVTVSVERPPVIVWPILPDGM